MFETRQQETVAQREERILDFWLRQQIFMKSLDWRAKSPLLSFYDGPPFATGLPQYGHIIAGTIKDVVPRYKTMKDAYELVMNLRTNIAPEFIDECVSRILSCSPKLVGFTCMFDQTLASVAVA